MAVQYDSEKGLNGWGVDFFNFIHGIKKELPEISEEIQDFFDLLNSDIENVKTWSTKELNNYAKGCNITDESFLKFLNDVDASGNIMEQYQDHLIKLQKEQSTLITFTQKASTALKSFGASLASIGINWAIGQIIGLAATAIDNFVNRVKYANEAMKDAVSEYKSTKSNLESISSELKDQKERLNDLLSKDKLTYAEKGQLEELQAITKELLLQQDIEERNVARASKEAADKAVDAYNKQYNDYDSTSENLNFLLNRDLFPASGNDPDDIAANIASYIKAKELLDESQGKFEEDLANGNDTFWSERDIQRYTDIIESTTDLIDNNLSDLREKKLALEDEYNKVIEKKQNGKNLSSSEQDIINAYESIYNTIKLVYEYTNQNAWNNMEMSDIFNTEGIEKTKDELIAMAKAGELTPETIASYQNLSQAIEDSELFFENGTTAIEAFCEEIYASAEALSALGESIIDPQTFDISTYKDQIDDIQSSISTLQSALDSLNSGTLDESSVIDLMQQFPELVPYIDLTADGFGNLSEGLSILLAQQPSKLISELEELKDALATDEERQQVDLLIDSLQRLSSYGDSGIEAYAATISNTWGDTANVIESVTTQFENLAKVQEAVADGLTMSSTAAAELAKMYPEILTNAVNAGNGQITLNEEVVRTILDGDKSIIDAQIKKLEADKAELEAKKTFAEAQLEIAKNVGEGEGKRFCPLPQ